MFVVAASTLTGVGAAAYSAAPLDPFALPDSLSRDDCLSSKMSVCPPPGIRHRHLRCFVAGRFLCGRNPASHGAVLLAQKEMDVENLPGLGGKLLWEDDKLSLIHI